ncbi:MAG: hypothetical protein QNJ11_07195 [Woeseiaceae bacterium]|nr:hypothetical protein [Woeseiaceae bacterium]
MADDLGPDETPRQVSRWIAYPALAIFPITSIALGLKLGKLGIGKELMVASMESTPAENWVMALLAACIAMLGYVNWAYSNRTLRCSAISVALVTLYIVVLFLFGVWGMYGLVGASLIWFIYFWVRNRELLRRNWSDDSES